MLLLCTYRNDEVCRRRVVTMVNVISMPVLTLGLVKVYLEIFDKIILSTAP